MRRRRAVAENYPEYRAWKGLRNRCNNPKNPQYCRYGARGITVCDRWSVFENFLADVGKKPSPLHSIDRVDNTGSYSPDNCRWATKREQSNNCRTNRLLEFQSKRLSLEEWARALSIAPGTIGWRLNHGWAVEKALATPARRKSR